MTVCRKDKIKGMFKRKNQPNRLDNRNKKSEKSEKKL